MSSHLVRASARSLTLVSLAFALHVGTAAAANSPDTLLQQQRELLSGRTATEAARPRGQLYVRAVRGAGDAHELARRLLLGSAVRAPGRASASAARARGKGDYGDAQQHVQGVLVGRRDAAATRS